jgi:hypothetical protein
MDVSAIFKNMSHSVRCPNKFLLGYIFVPISIAYVYERCFKGNLSRVMFYLLANLLIRNSFLKFDIKSVIYETIFIFIKTFFNHF